MITPQRIERPVLAKDSGTRLLDLLHGWATYVEAQEQEFPDSVTSEQIEALYQEMGNYAVQYDGKSMIEQDELTRKFIENRVMPYLLGFRK